MDETEIAISKVVSQRTWLEKMRTAGIKGALADRGIPLKLFPESIQMQLSNDLDDNADGFLAMDELEEMLTAHTKLKKANASGQVSIASLPDKVQNAFKVFDMDGDGMVDPKELHRAAELYEGLKKRSKLFVRIIFGLALILLLVIGCISLMTYAVVELSKETSTSPTGVMTVKDNPKQAVQVETVEVNAPMDSRLSNAAFHSLQRFEVTKDRNYLSLKVQGWARLFTDKSVYGSVVIIVTEVGQIILDGTEMEFEESAASLFTRAGFKVSPSRRRLQGLYELVAFFNSLSAVDVENLGSQPLPRFPDKFYVEFTQLYNCRQRERPQDAWEKEQGIAVDLSDRCSGPDFEYAPNLTVTTVRGVKYAIVHGRAWVEYDSLTGTGQSREEYLFPSKNHDQKYVRVVADTKDRFFEQGFQMAVGSGGLKDLPADTYDSWCKSKDLDKNNPDHFRRIPLIDVSKAQVSYAGVEDLEVTPGKKASLFDISLVEQEGTTWKMRNDIDSSLPLELKIMSPGEEIIWRFDKYVVPSDNAMIWTDDLFAPGECPNTTEPWNVPGTYHIRSQTPWPDNQVFTRSELLDCDYHGNAEQCIYHEALASLGITENHYLELRQAYETAFDNLTYNETWTNETADEYYEESEYALMTLSISSVVQHLSEKYAEASGEIPSTTDEVWGVATVNLTDMEEPIPDNPEVTFTPEPNMTIPRLVMNISEEELLAVVNVTMMPETDEEQAKHNSYISVHNATDGRRRSLLDYSTQEEGDNVSGDHFQEPVAALDQKPQLRNTPAEYKKQGEDEDKLEMYYRSHEGTTNSKEAKDPPQQTWKPHPDHDSAHPRVKRLTKKLASSGDSTVTTNLITHVRSSRSRLLSLRNPLMDISTEHLADETRSDASSRNDRVEVSLESDDHTAAIGEESVPTVESSVGLHRALLGERSLLQRKGFKRSNAQLFDKKDPPDEGDSPTDLKNGATYCEDEYVNTIPLPPIIGPFGITFEVEVLLSAMAPAFPGNPQPSSLCWGQVTVALGAFKVVEISGSIMWDFGTKAKSSGVPWGLNVEGCISGEVGALVKGVELTLLEAKICIYGGVEVKPDWNNEAVGFFGVYAEITLGCDYCGFKGTIKADGRIQVLPSRAATRYYARNIWGDSDEGCKKDFLPAWTFQFTLSGKAELCMAFCGTVWEGNFYQSNPVPILFPFCDSVGESSGQLTEGSAAANEVLSKVRECARDFWTGDQCIWDHNTGCKGHKNNKNHYISQHKIGQKCYDNGKFLGGFRINDKVCSGSNDATVEYYCRSLQDSGYRDVQMYRTNCFYGRNSKNLQWFDNVKIDCEDYQGKGSYLVKVVLGDTYGCGHNNIRTTFWCAKPNNMLSGWQETDHCQEVTHEIAGGMRGNPWYYMDRTDVKWCPEYLPVLRSQRFEPVNFYTRDYDCSRHKDCFRWVTQCCRYHSGTGSLQGSNGVLNFEDRIIDVSSSFDSASSVGDYTGRFAIAALEIGGSYLYHIESMHVLRHIPNSHNAKCVTVDFKYSADPVDGVASDPDRPRRAMCPPGHFITHLTRDNSNYLGGLRTFQCCAPFEVDPETVSGMETFEVDVQGSTTEKTDGMVNRNGYFGCASKPGYALIGLGLSTSLGCPKPTTSSCKTEQKRAVDPATGAILSHFVWKEVCDVSEPTTCYSGTLRNLKWMVCGKIPDFTLLPPSKGFYDFSKEGVFLKTSYGPIGVYKIKVDPSPYSNRELITFKLKGPAYIGFTYFDVEGGSTCQFDWLLIEKESSSWSKKLCGSTKPKISPGFRNGHVVYVTDSVIKFTFRTDGSVTKSGFEIKAVKPSDVRYVYNTPKVYGEDDQNFW